MSWSEMKRTAGKALGRPAWHLFLRFHSDGRVSVTDHAHRTLGQFTADGAFEPKRRGI